MDHHAGRARLRFNVGIRLLPVQSPRVRDGRDRRRDHLEEGEQDENPRKTRMPGKAHERDEFGSRVSANGEALPRWLPEV